MPRRARIVCSEMPHHVIQRGNRRQKVFFREQDKKSYLTILAGYIKKYECTVWAYCLMDNHLHLIIVPKKAENMSKAIGETHKAYTRLINEREKWRGYLWEGRYKSFVMDLSYLYRAIRYVEMNPVRANLVVNPESYPWSSAKFHIFNKKNNILSDSPLSKKIKNWRQYLHEGSEKDLQEIRKQINSNKPRGSEQFINRLELKFGKIVRKLKVGRKSKK